MMNGVADLTNQNHFHKDETGDAQLSEFGTGEKEFQILSRNNLKSVENNNIIDQSPIEDGSGDDDDMKTSSSVTVERSRTQTTSTSKRVTWKELDSSEDPTEVEASSSFSRSTVKTTFKGGTEEPTRVEERMEYRTYFGTDVVTNCADVVTFVDDDVPQTTTAAAAATTKLDCEGGDALKFQEKLDTTKCMSPSKRIDEVVDEEEENLEGAATTTATAAALKGEAEEEEVKRRSKLGQDIERSSKGGREVDRSVEVLHSPIRPSALVVVPRNLEKQLSAQSPISSGSSPFESTSGAPFTPECIVLEQGSTADLSNTTTTSAEMELPGDQASHFVVVAIDFGTTMSGYAFSFVRDPTSIHMMRKWEGGDPGIINQKTPTTLLLNPDGNFHSFGFTARDFYHDLDPKDAKRWLYFEKFKMALHYNAKLNKDTTITASNGKQFSALKVFCHALRYFKDHALQELSDQSSTEILNEDIRWVLTVPAIWKAPAKQFMRQAAYEAGIASPDHPNQLLIALEPEAASIYVRKLRVHQLVSDSSTGQLSPQIPFKADDTLSSTPSPPPPTQNLDDNIQRLNESQDSTCSRIELLQFNLRLFDSLPRQRTVGLDVNDEGNRYMVVDCGGGTVDITVHEMESKHGFLHELYKATGGPYGSVGVDLAFEALLVQIFGSEFIETFKHKRPAGWVDLMIAFESRKRAASPYKDNSLNVSLPFSFIDYYKKTKGHQIENAIVKFGDAGIRWSQQGMLRLSPEVMKRLFHATLERIKQAIGDVLNAIRDIKYLFLVGGFAESLILQREIRHEFGHILKILIPQDVALTILKGAVCFGLDPTIVNVRRSRQTYGVEVLNKFNPEKHPKSKLVRKDGIDWCTEVFDTFVSVDQAVSLGESVIRSYAPAKVGQKTCVINVFCSEKNDVRFVTDVGVTRCGTLLLDLTDIQRTKTTTTQLAGDPNQRREIQTRMTFGDTEIKVDALDLATGINVVASIDFLNK